MEQTKSQNYEKENAIINRIRRKLRATKKKKNYQEKQKRNYKLWFLTFDRRSVG